MKLGIRAYARHRKEVGLPGAYHNAVRRAIERGQILLEGGLIDAEVADQAWPREELHQQGEAGKLRGAEVQGAEPGNPLDASLPAEDGSYRNVRLRSELATARRREYEVELLRGTLIRKDVAKSQAFEALRMARDRTLQLPDRLAEVFATEILPSRIHSTLTAEIREAFEESARLIELLGRATR